MIAGRRGGSGGRHWGNLAPDRAGAPDAWRRSSAAGGDGVSWENVGGGPSGLLGERRRSGDRAHGSRTYRLAAGRSALVPVSGVAARFLEQYSVALSREYTHQSTHISAVHSPNIRSPLPLN